MRVGIVMVRNKKLKYAYFIYILNEVNRCYQPSVDEKWALYEGGE